jgi:hypothetical protein
MALPRCHPTAPSVSVSAFVFRRDRFLAEIPDQVKRDPGGNDILEKEETQITDVPHPVNPRYGNNRAGGSYDHSTGCKEHDRRDERSYDAGLGAKIARDNQDGGKPHGKADNNLNCQLISGLLEPRKLSFGARSCHFKRSCPEEHNNHADTGDQKGDITITYPRG